MDLARRVSNTRSYGQRLAKKGIERYEKEFLAEPQPLRTDLEFVTEDRPFIDIEIPPGDAPSGNPRRTAAAFEPYTQCKFQASDERSA